MDNGLERGIFIQSSMGQGALVGRSWPGEVVYVDFLHDDVNAYWQDVLQKYKTDINFSGLWLGMGEIDNPFCTGTCIPNQERVSTQIIKQNMVYVPSAQDLEMKGLGKPVCSLIASLRARR